MVQGIDTPDERNKRDRQCATRRLSGLLAVAALAGSAVWADQDARVVDLAPPGWTCDLQSEAPGATWVSRVDGGVEISGDLGGTRLICVDAGGTSLMTMDHVGIWRNQGAVTIALPPPVSGFVEVHLTPAEGPAETTRAIFLLTN